MSFMVTNQDLKYRNFLHRDSQNRIKSVTSLLRGDTTRCRVFGLYTQRLCLLRGERQRRWRLVQSRLCKTRRTSKGSLANSKTCCAFRASAHFRNTKKTYFKQRSSWPIDRKSVV